jgi:hypothetical protein
MHNILVVMLMAMSAFAPQKSQVKVKVSATAGGHQAVLTWSPSSDGAANPTLGYNVYRGTTPGGESGTALNGTTPVAVNCTSTTTCTYTDTTITPGTWYWTVKATLNGTLSAASNEVSGTAAIAPPSGLTATAQ